MKILSLGFLMALLTLAPLGLHAESGEKAKPGEVKAEKSATEYNTWSAKVTKINKADRMLTLQADTGISRTIHAGPEVKNFDQIKVGDLVVIRSSESLALTLTKHKKGEKPTGAAMTAMETAPEGDKPGAAGDKAMKISAEVTKVDTSKQMIDLKGPEGNTVSLKVSNPATLNEIKKGDMVTATYNRAVAISVENQPPAPGK